MLLIQALLPKTGCVARSGIKLDNPTSITIHWIGPYPRQTSETPREWWLTSGTSAHFIVKNDTVLQCIPTDEVAWHCGCDGNYSSIGIEVIPANKEGLFGPVTINTLRELIKTLPDIKLLRHYDWTGKDCPRYYTPTVNGGEARWSGLKHLLKDTII